MLDLKRRGGEFDERGVASECSDLDFSAAQSFLSSPLTTLSHGRLDA
jgi:hypothetical protein